MTDMLTDGLEALIQIAVVVTALRAMKGVEQRLVWLLFAAGGGLLLAGSLIRLALSQTFLSPWFSLAASSALLGALLLLVRSDRFQGTQRPQLAESQNRLDALTELTRRAMGGGDLKAVQDLACSLATNILKADAVLLLEREAGLHSLTISAYDGWNMALAANRLSVDDPVISRLLAGGEPLSWESADSQQGILTELLARDGAVVITGTAVPGPADPSGVLIIHRRHQQLFAPDDLKYLSRIAHVLDFARQTRTQRESSRTLELMRQGTTSLVFCFDRMEAVNYVNDSGQELLGFTPTQQLGLNLQKIYPDWALKRLRQEAIPRAVEAGAWSGEASIRTRTGREIATYQILLAHRKSTGEIAYFTCYAYDLASYPLATAQGLPDSELRHRVRSLETQLEEARKDTEIFAESTGRSLREPLGAIASFCKTLVNRHAEEMSVAVRRYIQLVDKAAASAGQVTIRLAQVARLARHPLNVRPVDMAKLAQSSWNELTAEMNGQQPQLRMRTLFPVPGDEAMLRRVFNNLLSNSLKYTRDIGEAEVEVGSRAEGSRYIYYVRDNGIGFDMEDLDKMFGLFQKLHKSDEDDGAGMGLYEVKHIVQRHGGEVWAQGGSGLGATIFFSLPSSRPD